MSLARFFDQRVWRGSDNTMDTRLKDANGVYFMTNSRALTHATKIYCTLAVILLSPSIISVAREKQSMPCIYSYTGSATRPDMGRYREERSSRFELPLVDSRLEPEFCDDTTASFSKGPLSYVECTASDRLVKTHYDVILDRRNGSITTLMDIRLDGVTQAKMIHMGRCELNATPSDETSEE